MSERFDLVSLRSTSAETPTIVVRVDPDSLEGEIVVATEFVTGETKIWLHPDDIEEWAEVLEALDAEEIGSWMGSSGRTALTIEWDDEDDEVSEDDEDIWVTVEDHVASMVTLRVRVEPDEYWLDDQFDRLAKFRELSPKLSGAR